MVEIVKQLENTGRAAAASPDEVLRTLLQAVDQSSDVQQRRPNTVAGRNRQGRGHGV